MLCWIKGFGGEKGGNDGIWRGKRIGWRDSEGKRRGWRVWI
jgi:hypothetical protein